MGPYIASQTVKKVIEINPFLLGTMAGGAAGAGAGGAADAATSLAGRQTPPLQCPSVFFGNAAPQPGHVAMVLGLVSHTGIGS